MAGAARALTVEALHHSLRATGPGGEIYLSWSSDRAKPEGPLYASDLRLSRSLDGGRTFGPPLRVNDDRPISHSFDGLAVLADGTVLVSWIDGRERQPNPATYLARVADRGERVEQTARLDGDACVCLPGGAARGALSVAANRGARGPGAAGAVSEKGRQEARG